jgi:tetratricopeptide (TPR) repeat protein
MMKRILLLFAVALSVAVVSCRKGASGPSFRETLGGRIAALLQEGRTNDVICLLEDSMGRDDCLDIRPALFAHALDLRSRTETVGAIRARYLKGSDRDAVMAASGFRGVEGGMRAAGRLNELAEWCRSLLHLPLPVQVRVWAYRYAMDAARSVGNVDDFSMLAAQAVSSLPQDMGVELVESVSKDALRDRDERAAKRLLELLEKGPPADSGYGKLGQALGVRIALAFSDAAAAAAEYRARFARLGDGYAAALFAELTAAGANDPELVTGLCRFALRNAGPADGLFNSAAGRLIDTVRIEKRSGPVIAVLKELRELRIGPQQLAWELSRVFHDAIQRGTKEEQKELLDLAWPLLDELPDKNGRHDLGLLLLDGCALAEDYQRALALLDKGIPGQDAASAGITRHKILAHIAMNAGDHVGAITNLEAFMELLEPDQWLPDPLSGPDIPTDYIKALNLARIAGLWAGAGDSEKSALKYREARERYGAVVRNPRTDERLKKKIEEELARLPSEPPVQP